MGAPEDIIIRILKKVTFCEHTASCRECCFLFVGAKNSGGYGIVSYKGKLFVVHRIIYSFVKDEEVPRHRNIKHTCGVKNCVQPAHLYKSSKVRYVEDWVLDYYLGRDAFGKSIVTFARRVFQTIPDEELVRRLEIDADNIRLLRVIAEEGFNTNIEDLNKLFASELINDEEDE